MRHYIDIPQSISLDDIKANNFILSSNSYKRLIMKNENYKQLRHLLDRNLTRQDLGQEVGSFSYIKDSPYRFMRSKALQSHSFLPQINQETSLPILPQSFTHINLKKGDLIISKDSNIGEIVILDDDYPNTMLSGALYKLPISQNKFYIFALIKHDMFKQQLDFIVPKGATIRHAKTLFLDCKIPFPNHNKEQTINFIETLTKSIIIKEKLIKERHTQILNYIEKELLANQKPNKFIYTLPNINEIKASTRLDTGVYCEEFKRLDFLIKNYTNGTFYIDKNNIKSGSTPKTRYIADLNTLKYTWLTPSHCSDYGTIQNNERLNLLGQNNINADCILLVNRGDGEDCGKAVFYCFQDFKDGHHNQGMYRVSNYEIIKLIFMLCFLNAKMMRNYCSFLSLGAKMQELKIEHFLQIPFPNFPLNLQKEITTLYHNPNAKLCHTELNLENFSHKDKAFCTQAGIYELDKSVKHFKKLLNHAIDNIISDKPVNVKFDD